MDLDRRAQVHAALGDVSRLSIVDALVSSDRSPTELGRLVGLPSNLLAHHLDVLDSAGLIERLQSSGDRRRRYVRVRCDVLRGLGLGQVTLPRRIVFVCTQNSARSQLAAALWTSHTGLGALSAGTHPAERVHPGAVAAAERVGVDLTRARPEAMTGVPDDAQLVTVCDQAHEDLGTAVNGWHWSIADPVPLGSDEAFDAAVRELDERISTLTRPGGSSHG